MGTSAPSAFFRSRNAREGAMPTKGPGGGTSFGSSPLSQIPERFGFPSAARGAGAARLTRPSAVRGADFDLNSAPGTRQQCHEPEARDELHAGQSSRVPGAATMRPVAGMAFDLTVNGRAHRIDADPQTPLLWVVRDHVGLTGTKFSCGIGQCGACTLHVDGRAVRSCSVPASTAIGKPVTTIEGVSPDGTHPIQMAWKELDAPQCGYCQSGMIMSALALLRDRPRPTDADIDARVTNACRCGTYHRVRKAIHLAADLMGRAR